jgi:hypothetical protein
MILSDQPLSAATPALWYVTNGDAVVGPVGTDLLLRGITNARIPDDCMVIQESWGEWRSLLEIRELSAIGPVPSWIESSAVTTPRVPEEMVQRAHDAGEALLFAMHAAVTAIRATAGLVHRIREPFVGLVTSSVHGVDDQLGQVVPRLDPALAAAHERKILIGRPDEGPAERAIARRFSACDGELRGVAMVPVFDGDNLLAMLELARTDHPFRAGDTETLLQIAQIVSRK